MPFPQRRPPLSAAATPQITTAFLVILIPFVASSARAQTRNPYYELQCSMSGAYCDRVYETTPKRPETFDELLARKDRERAQRAQEREERRAREAREREERAARERAQREQERLALEERQRQARIAAEQERQRAAQLTAQRIASAPALIRWFRTGWPVPQWIIAGPLLAFGAIAGIGRRAFSAPPGPGFFTFAGLSLVSLLFTYSASARADPWFALLAAFIPTLAFIVLNALHFLRGYHHLFVRHPAEPVVAAPLRTGALFPKAQLGHALRPSQGDVLNPPPTYQSQNLFEKARAVKERITADADIADAAMRRDRARAAQIHAEAELREARRRLPWWKRWLVR